MAIGSSGKAHIDMMLLGYSWTGKAKVAGSVTYNTNLDTAEFDTLSTNTRISATGISKIGLSGTNAALTKAMHAWSDVANITFIRSASEDPQLMIRKAATLNYYGLVARESVAGSQFKKLNMLLWSNRLVNAQEGTHQYQTIVHELGHTLGLSHPNNAPHDPEYDYSTTIMSYNKYKNYYAHTPMIYDIAAAQYLYGANEDHKNGDDTHAATGEKKLWTIWDAGGLNDKLDIANAKGASKGAVIDLRGGVDAANDNILHKKLVMIKNYA